MLTNSCLRYIVEDEVRRVFNQVKQCHYYVFQRFLRVRLHRFNERTHFRHAADQLLQAIVLALERLEVLWGFQESREYPCCT